MFCSWLRRALALAACASLLLLAGCGSGSIEAPFTPTRVIGFGDGFSDLGQAAGARYTVNDGTTNIWAQQVAVNYGLSLTAVAAGGLSYATGNVRIVAKPDAAGNNATLTVKEQIDAFLATGSVSPSDLVLVNAGIGDIVAEMARFTAGTQTGDQLLANLKQAGRELGAQVRRLAVAGATHVVVVGPYNLGKSPWAFQIGQTSVLQDVSNKFNEELLISMVDLGGSVLYVDAALQFNLMSSFPTSYGMVNSVDLACTSVDPGPGIGTGAGQVNSALCTPGTIAAGAVYNQFLFADRIYPTPQGHTKFAEYAYGRIRTRW